MWLVPTSDRASERSIHALYHRSKTWSHELVIVLLPPVPSLVLLEVCRGPSIRNSGEMLQFQCQILSLLTKLIGCLSLLLILDIFRHQFQLNELISWQLRVFDEVLPLESLMDRVLCYLLLHGEIGGLL